MSATAVETPRASRISSDSKALKFLAQYGVVIALVLLLIAALIWAPSFYTPSTLRNTMRQASIIGIVTIGQFLVLMIRGIDLSIPAVIGFTAVLIAENGPGPIEGIVIAVLIAVAVGLVNYFLVVKRKVPAFVATFGMLVALEGARLVYTRGSASGTVAEGFVTIGRATFLGLTVSTWVWVGLIAVVWIVLYRTRAGRRMVMVGSNPTMAEFSGIRTNRYFLSAFVASAVLACLAAVFLAGSSGYVDRFMGQGTDLDSITAALLGGARFSGGQGSLLGAAAGALLLSSLLTLIVLLGWSPQLALIAKGLVLILAIALQSTAGRGSAR